MRLIGKVAIVTGAGTGIGEATARLFAREGAQVILMGRRVSLLRSVAKKIEWETGRVDTWGVPGDVSQWKDCRRTTSAALRKWGRIDILVNNAGVGWGNAPHKTPEKEWDRVMRINLKGSFLMTKAVVPPMLKRRAGSIVNISSILGLVAMPDCSAYNASKGGVVQLTRSTALDYARQGIRCNCVCPGGVVTPMLAGEMATPKGRRQLNDMHPIGRMGKPIDVAYAVLYFASDESGWVTGSVLAVDGGYTAT